MSALDKFYDFTLNLPDAKLTYKAMSLCNIDRNVFNIYLTLQEGKNNPILNANLGDYTVTMIVVKPKTKEYVEKVGVVDGSNDRLLFELGETFNDQIGSYKGEIKVQSGDEVITSSSFAYTVTQSLISGLNAEIEANPDVEILRKLINEVKAAVGMTPEDPDSLLTDYQKKTDLSLTTTDKTIVGAINELKLNGGSGSGNVDLSGYQTKTDVKLTTTSKEIVGAINEHDSKIKDIAKDLIIEGNKLYLKKSDGTKIGIGVTLPTNSGEGGNVVFRDLAAGEILKISGTDTSIVYGNIVLSKSSTTIVEGGTDTFTVKLDKAPTNNQIITLTSNNSDVTINTTTLTFTSENYNTAQTITITVAEDDDYSNETCIITLASSNVANKTLIVNITDNDTAPNIAVESISLPSTLTVKQNKTTTLTATILPSDATNKNITWSVDNGNCTVSGTSLNATVTGVNMGSAIITATTQDGSKVATCTVTVEENQSTGDVEQNNLLSYYKSSNATSTLLTDEKGINNITLEGSPTLSDGYLVFDSSSKKGVCSNLQGFTNNGVGDFTIQVCVNYNGNAKRQFIKVGSSSISYQDGTAETSWGEITNSNIETTSFEYNLLNTGESNALSGVDVVYTLVKNGENMSLYKDIVNKQTKAINGSTLKTYNTIELLTSSNENVVKFKYLAIYNSSLTDEQIANNVAIMKGGN